MEIRFLKEQEITPALSLIKDVFEQDVASCFSVEGEREFANYIEEKFVKKQVRQGKLFFWGAGEKNRLIGVAACSVTGHLTFCYVKKSYQNKAIGKTLLQTAIRFVNDELHLDKVTVNATPNAVEFFLKQGFHSLSMQKDKNGYFYVPMELKFNKNKESTSNKKRVFVFIGIAIVTIGIVLFISFASFFNRFIHELEKQILKDPNILEEPFGPFHDFGEDGNEGDLGELPYGNKDGSYDDPNSGIHAIDCYVAPGLSYKYENKQFKENEKSEDPLEPYIDFDVNYPELSGLDQKVQDKVNKELKKVAMETTEKIYFHPSDELDEKLYTLENSVLSSKVSYEVTYATDDLLCVAFQDYSFAGKTTDMFQQLRTVTFDLQTGEVLDLKDLIEIDEAFVSDWRELMRKEVKSDRLLIELDEKEMISILRGNPIRENYFVAYFLKKGGLEIGCSFNYAQEDSYNAGYGWVTAPYSFSEIEKYQKDVPFWGLLAEEHY